MPSTSPRTARHTFATSGPPRPGAFAPAGAPRRVTSRSLNDAVIRRGTPPPARPRTTAGPTLLVFLTSSGQSLSIACTQFSQGVMDGLGDSLKGTWGLLSHDMWQLATYREMGTTLTALGLLDPLNVAQSLAAARALDARLGTHVARRMADIINAVKQLMRDAPHWTARQWGRAVGRVIGDLVLAKGATGGAKLAASSATTLNRVAATRYLARTPSFAEAFSEVKGFNVGVGQRSFKVQEELKRARTGRWLSNQRMATPAETALKLALDYPGSLNRASRRWTVRRFGIYVEGTVASQHNPLGGGGHQLLRVMAKEAGYVEVPYK